MFPLPHCYPHTADAAVGSRLVRDPMAVQQDATCMFVSFASRIYK